MPKKFLGREQRCIQTIHVTGIPRDIPERVKAYKMQTSPRRYVWKYYEDAINMLVRDLEAGRQVEVVETTRRRAPQALRVWADEGIAMRAIALAEQRGWTISDFVLTALVRQLEEWEALSKAPGS